MSVEHEERKKLVQKRIEIWKRICIDNIPFHPINERSLKHQVIRAFLFLFISITNENFINYNRCGNTKMENFVYQGIGAKARRVALATSVRQAMRINNWILANRHSYSR